MTRTHLREARAEDVDAVMMVMARAFDPAYGEGWNRAQLQGMLALPDVWLSVAEEPGSGPCGFALSRLVADEVELLLLAVDPEWRRRGIGAALVAHVGQAAKERAARQLFLEVRADNPALAFYNQAGFAQIGRRPAYYRGGDGSARDAITLALALPSRA